jgi:lysophospholipase L1-like esterase
MSYPVRIIKLFCASLFLISPLIISSFSPILISTKPELIEPLRASKNTQINPVIDPKPKEKSSEENKMALLIGKKGQSVLGASSIKTDQITNENSPISAKVGAYTIAVLGDSMIDVLQPGLPQLANALKSFYPSVQFKLLNYGVGATGIEYGLKRLTTDYTYLGQEFSALLSQNPDIIVIESFAYNHGPNSQAGLDHQWLTLAQIIETIKSQSQARIILAATIGPDETTLCDGIDGLDLPPDQKITKAQAIRAYLQNLINFADSQGYPLANAYHFSLNNSGNGKAVYINQGDHLHPSGPGGELMAQKIAEAIYQNRLL